ncbi:hypothetical protein ACTFIU_005849 [Dictyostelium citrinum]
MSRVVTAKLTKPHFKGHITEFRKYQVDSTKDSKMEERNNEEVVFQWQITIQTVMQVFKSLSLKSIPSLYSLPPDVPVIINQFFMLVDVLSPLKMVLIQLKTWSPVIQMSLPFQVNVQFR